MDKRTIRKIVRIVLYWGDIMSIILLLLTFYLDVTGYFSVLFPNLPKNYVSYFVFALYILINLISRVRNDVSESDLYISDSGWETIKSGDIERLFVKVENDPILKISNKGDSLSTSARIVFVSKKEKQIVHDFSDVRWQGTPPPIAKGYEYQPYDGWTVSIKSGRNRLLYIALRDKTKKKNNSIYIHNDKTYYGDNWKPKELKLKEKDCYICIVIGSSSFEKQSFWFSFDGDKLIQKVPEKEIQNVVVV